MKPEPLTASEIQKTTITLPKALYLRWRHAALDRGTTQRQSIIEALELWLAVGETPAVKPPGRKGDSSVRRYLSEIGRKGAKKGAQARMESLTPERRQEIARQAAQARWGAAKP